jgi:ParB-like chromosome segregation protein Spo0J
MAARVLKLDTVPCIRLGHLNELQRRAYVLADNRIALNSGWDEAMLALELTELLVDGLNLESLGFDVAELEKLGVGVDEVQFPELADGDKQPFQTMSFTLHDEQVEVVRRALDKAKSEGAFDGPNENSNGNALARVCAAYCGDV